MSNFRERCDRKRAQKRGLETSSRKLGVRRKSAELLFDPGCCCGASEQCCWRGASGTQQPLAVGGKERHLRAI
jgi:hypothetical protein